MVTVTVVMAPSSAPVPVGLLRVTVKLSSPSTNESSAIGMLMVCGSALPSAQVKVSLAAVKSAGPAVPVAVA